jgi:hypothetical protein
LRDIQAIERPTDRLDGPINKLFKLLFSYKHPQLHAQAAKLLSFDSTFLFLNNRLFHDKGQINLAPSISNTDLNFQEQVPTHG